VKPNQVIITGKRVLITGSGSISSEVLRQLRAFNPGALHTTGLEGDRVDEVFGDASPDVVFHAAVNKHASALERHPSEAVKANVLGTDNMVRAASRYGAERFVLISPEADPTTILGASMRAAELIVQGAAHKAAEQGSEAVFATVRIGDALDPHDSLLNNLTNQIRAGGPVTITHPNAARCFTTVEEAAALALEAARMATGGEIYTLDLGEPVKITDVVARLTQQYCLPDVPIRFVSSQQGEKPRPCQGIPTDHPQILTTLTNLDPVEQAKLPVRLEKLYSAARKNRDPKVRQMLMKLAGSTVNQYPDRL
jgi:FlaA1/EpsC-like NDP-sugar epimerase